MNFFLFMYEQRDIYLDQIYVDVERKIYGFNQRLLSGF